MSENIKKPYLSLKNISKYFGITKALNNINIDIYEGEVIGLIGPNGAGKSTMIKTVTGVLKPTNGDIFILGNRIDNYEVKDSKNYGIACAYQDLSLCTNLAVYENFALLNAERSLIKNQFWREKAKKEAKELLEKYFPKNNIDVMTLVENLTLAERQIVEICKTLITKNLKVLVLDEPTSALSLDRAEQLGKIVKELREKKVSIIYISHKLEEIEKVSDRILLLKNGEIIEECDPRNVTTNDLITKMGGGSKPNRLLGTNNNYLKEEKIIEIDNHNCEKLKNISMYANKGEIIGISGLVGSGQTELLNLLFKNKKSDGLIIKGDVSYVSGDRKREGIFELWNISDNINISSLKKFKKGLFLDKSKMKNFAMHWYEKLKFKAEGTESPITSLSGGNQQKALIARGLASDSEIIILNDPTAGVDIETKQEIYSLLNEAKESGKTIILHSTEDAEMEICDRVYVMVGGSIVEELKNEEITISNIIQASFKKIDREVKENPVDRKFHKKINSKLILPILTMIVMLFINWNLNHRILSYFGIETIIGSALPLIFASLGQMYIIAFSDIDMSNGYSIGLANVLIAVVLTSNPFIGLVSLALFVLCYVGMSALIHLRKIPAIVVTLGAQFIWLGAALIISPSPGGVSPSWLNKIYKLKVPIVPMPVILTIIIAFITWYIVFRWKYGMVIRGVGNNPIAIERMGWSQLHAKATGYGLSGIMMILAGLSITAISLGSDPNGAAAYTMLSIATVILGGCEMSGGFIEPVGVVFGAIAMNLVTTLLTSIRINSNLQTAVTGIILILVLTLKLVKNRRKSI